MIITLQVRESRHGPVMFLVTLSAKGGLATGRIFLGLVGGIYGPGINSVLDTRVFNSRKGSRTYYLGSRLGECNRDPK